MNPKIVIIGAGPSGIAAATKLTSLGQTDVIILEAESRIGGRINTVPFADHVVDMGAQWCHGQTNNIVYQLAKQYEPFASTHDANIKDVCIKSNGERVNPDVSERLITIADGILDNMQEGLMGFKGSLGTYLYKKFEEALKLPENLDIDKDLAAQFIESHEKSQCLMEGSNTLFEVSAERYNDYWTCEGDQVLNWKDKGYITILKLLMGTYPNSNNENILENKILLGKKVDEIMWDRPDSSKCLIKCNDGENFEADHVICTVSIGVLKEQHLKLFSPNLPVSKTRAIDGIILGTVDKIYLEFPSPFWLGNDFQGFRILWLPEDLEIIRQSKNSWLEGLCAFYPVSFQPNVICGWMNGMKANQMETASDEEVIEGVVFLLNKFLNREVPAPVAMKRSTWHSNPNFRGSYSFRSTNEVLMETGPADLASPILRPETNIPVLQFAGEATHDHYYSTVHGAIETGWREAERLINLYKDETVS